MIVSWAIENNLVKLRGLFVGYSGWSMIVIASWAIENN